MKALLIIWGLVVVAAIGIAIYANAVINEIVYQDKLEQSQPTLMIEPVEIDCTMPSCNPQMTPEPIDLNNRSLRLEE